jgi:2-oxo-4-hydroxy-4-carboxy--5-ureidoimidazoline (OHCU) decarboxylase
VSTISETTLGSPPEPGSARREAHKPRKRSNRAQKRRLLKRPNDRLARKEGARGGTRGSPPPHLPRQLSADELAELFEGRTRFVERLAAEPDPLTRARSLVHELPLDEKREILDAHPAIGQGTGLSARSAAEQGADADPEILAGLARLNAAYEERHGFRFVVFVNRRPKAAILAVLEDRIENPTGVELEKALDELVAIAEDRWARA